MNFHVDRDCTMVIVAFAFGPQLAYEHIDTGLLRHLSKFVAF